MRESNSNNVYVHVDCRKKIIRKVNIVDNTPVCPPPKRLRSQSCDVSLGFDWKKNCCLCVKEIVFNDKFSKEYRNKNVIHRVETVEIKNTFLEYARLRNDNWGDEVFTRIQGLSVGDLFAAEAKYHDDCYHKFRYKTIKAGKGRLHCAPSQDEF